MAAPGPLLGSVADAGGNRIHCDVCTCGNCVTFVEDRSRREAPLEHVAATTVSLVEVLAVAALQPLHPGRERLQLGAKHEVEVGSHETVGADQPLLGFSDPSKEREKAGTVSVVDEDPQPTIPT
jgi:hypothetical protein